MIQTAIHKGPMLRHIDARMITNPASSAMPWTLAEEPRASPCRRACATGGCSQRRAHPSVQPGRSPSSVHRHSLMRYIHTHYGIAAHSDVENAARLGRRHFGADGRRADQPLSESQSCAPNGGAAFLLIPEKPYHTLSILLLKSAVPPGYLQLIFLLFHTYSRKIANDSPLTFCLYCAKM